MMTGWRGRWWWWWRQAVVGTAVLLLLLLPGSLTEHPPQEEEEEGGLGSGLSGAVVEVSLKSDHAHFDAHGHAHTREDADTSVLKVTMSRRIYKFKLTPSSWLVSPGATISRVGGQSSGEVHSRLEHRPCLYQALADPLNLDAPSGTVSICHKDGPRVLLMIKKELAELVPRPKVLPPSPLSPPGSPNAHKRGEGGYTHVVKRHPLPGVMDQDCRSYDTCGRSPFPVPEEVPEITQVMVDPTDTDYVKRTGGKQGPGGGGGGDNSVANEDTSPLTVELGIFLDQALMDTFASFNTPEQELVDLVLGLVNNVQALYSHPSLGRQVDFTITHMKLLAQQPTDLPTHSGNRVNLLESFCAYNKKNNDPDDASPNHWDIGVYLSGLNFIVKKADGTDDGVTMGLAYTNGVCLPGLSCVINELGTVNYRGHPYPSAGALSSYVLAHEFGHSLGLRHDGVSNSCNATGYIMAAGRGLKGATTWSTCAREKIRQQKNSCLKEGGVAADGAASQWNHGKYLGLPGQRWDATAQCKLFLKDDDAGLPDPMKITEVCNSVTCVSPYRISTYLAGPALEGTYCGEKKWCRGGECVPWGKEGPKEVVAGGWGAWEHGECRSGCVEGGTGYQLSRRKCNTPAPVNSVAGCLGTETKRSLCNDVKVCGAAARKTVNQLASELCKVVSQYKPTIEGVGRQLSYSADTPWQACALYCQKKNSTSFWTPRYEFKDMPNISTHLPDGTPCHLGKEYVCQNRACLPKKPMGRSVLLIPEDILLEPDMPSDYGPIDVDNLFE
ncbi:A disintegrin and metalloproteinase with thrombospondin motifs adt-1-like isoform X1 [Portunus trituberculatus]|uniref:A disintegrin and metalloproteinase with thrombospondin motifs adt-1-like isoform X1 n=1 Tax=Portunus trituberculatus TaxID=210409 RepID=UPI001E1D0EDA|nr:A disintegrin and metalloproteinase with thrombospondin motifs adt-1-like isoform X1 [Portunus trituberculatus]XP_045102356.1 A disintegrin and metalloproteinase with thrombospondin motifs adt-1-like isoform X1 [Portunus trituberculatus]XP_045102358.1 A disintegrin and metalloproteinase with thrombospondin motifs adt-1-like isoform X1 [Portunus trituberculatus]XP_045102360.1 A disintegrin and metalloproteinase with thrombospondin motifs adt-1-like isoform X1 [Portunus trituberculatus]